MMLHQAKLAQKQAFLRRIVKIGLELFAISATVSRAHRMVYDRHPNHREAVELADLFCRLARKRIRDQFRELWINDDKRLYRLAMDVLKGRHEWLEEGVVSLADCRKAQKPKQIKAAPSKETRVPSKPKQTAAS